MDQFHHCQKELPKKFRGGLAKKEVLKGGGGKIQKAKTQEENPETTWAETNRHAGEGEFTVQKVIFAIRFLLKPCLKRAGTFQVSNTLSPHKKRGGNFFSLRSSPKTKRPETQRNPGKTEKQNKAVLGKKGRRRGGAKIWNSALFFKKVLEKKGKFTEVGQEKVPSQTQG